LYSGSTLTATLIDKDNETIYCANVGDSKAILIWDQLRRDLDPLGHCTDLTIEHWVGLPKEK